MLVAGPTGRFGDASGCEQPSSPQASRCSAVRSGHSPPYWGFAPLLFAEEASAVRDGDGPIAVIAVRWLRLTSSNRRRAQAREPLGILTTNALDGTLNNRSEFTRYGRRVGGSLRRNTGSIPQRDSMAFVLPNYAE